MSRLVLIRFYKHVQTCPDMSRLSILSRLVLNHKMTKYSKIWANGRKKVSNDDVDDDEVISWIASSNSSDQKYNHV